MKLALAAIHLEASPRSVPLGPAMLAAVLRRTHPEAIETRVLDLFLTDTAEACAEEILATEPEAVGFSIYVWNRARAQAIAGLLRARRPSLLLFAGGAEVTADPEGLQAEGWLDLVLPGEGEELIVAVMDQLLAGVALPEVQASIRPAIVKDLGTLPSPYLEGSLDPTAYSGMLWELSRGCPFRCDFCFESRGTAGTRRVPMARVVAELERFETCGVSQVFVLDPTFNYDTKQAKAILRLIAERAPAIHFFFEIRSEFIDAELAELFAALRCTLQIGLQSADDAVLRRISRNIDREDFEAKVLLLHQAGAVYGFDLIYGLPGDTFAGFCASLDFALSLAPNHLDLFPLSVLPGTRLHDTAPGFGLEHLQEIPYTVLASPTFPEVDMRAAARLAKACDRLYNEGKAVPWFGLLLGAMDLTPSQLFLRFADFLEAQNEGDITTLLAVFVGTSVPDPKVAAVAADLVTYFGRSGALLEAEALAPETEHACLVDFHHDPRALLGLLEAGLVDLDQLAEELTAAPCRARLSVVRGELILEVLETS